MKPFIWHARVYYEDTDAGGVVYYANYLKYMERARTEWLRSLGVEQDQLAENMNVIFAVRLVKLKYIQPARFNNALSITVEPHSLKPASVSFKQCVMNERDKSILYTIGEVNVVCLSAKEFTPHPIPKDLFKEIKSAC